MTNAQTSTLVLKNEALDYFLVPQAALERGRVPAERKAEVERMIAAGDASGDDVQGHLLAAFALAGTWVGILAATNELSAAEKAERQEFVRSFFS